MKKKVRNLDDNLRNFQVKFSEFTKSNYYEELNSHKFMRITNIAAYVVGVLGYDESFTNVDFMKKKWSLFTPTILLPIFNFPFIAVCFFNELHSDIYKALTIIPVLLTASLVIIQGFRMIQLEKELKNLLTFICESWNKELRIGIDDEVVKNAKNHLFNVKLYCFALSLAVIPWLARPLHAISVYYFLNGSETFMNIRVLPTEYPFAMDTIWKWVICYIWEAATVLVGIFGFITIDTGFIQLCALASLHVQIIGNKFRGVVKQNDREDNDCRLVNRLSALVKQHDQILTFCYRIEHALNPVILMIMISASISLCTCVITFEKELSKNNFMAAAASLSHFLVVVVQTVAYCNTAENLHNWLVNILYEIYESQWIGHSKKVQRIVIFIMLRSQRQFKFTTYGLYTVDREQLKKIARLAVNLLTVLRNIRTSKA